VAYLRKPINIGCADQTFGKAGLHLGVGDGGASVKRGEGRMKGVGMLGVLWERAMVALRAAWCSSQETDFAAIARRQ